MSKLLFALALLLIFASSTFATSEFAIPNSDAPTYCQAYVPSSTAAGLSPNQNGLLAAGSVTYGNVLPEAIEISVFALTISFAVVAIAYILSRIVPNMGIKNWLSTEYWEIAKSAIIIASIFAMITIVGNIVTFAMSNPTPLVGGDVTPLINGAETYLCNVNYNVMNIWGWMGLLGSGTGFWANLKIGTYDFIPLWTVAGLISGSTFVPFNNWMLQTGNAMIGPYGSVIGDTVNLLLFPFTVINLIAIDSLPSMAIVGLTIFIPLGLVFRAIPFIRGIGGTLIAIGLGLALVFPATLVMFNGVFMNYLGQAIAINPPPPPSQTFFSGLFITHCPFAGSSYSVFGLVGAGFCATLQINPFYNLFPSFLDAITFTASNDQVGRLNGANVFSDTAIYQYMDILLSTVSYVIIQLIVITIDLVIVYSLTDSIARALGGSVRLQLGGKLRIAS